jgi:hypothetical protein
MTTDDARPADLAIEGEMLETLMKEWQKAPSPKGAPKKRRNKRKRGFEIEWVKFTARMRKRLRGASSATYDLAIAILFEAFKLEQMAVKEIVLSKATTGLSKDARRRAINNLVRLGVIKVRRKGGSTAPRVIKLFP